MYTSYLEFRVKNTPETLLFLFVLNIDELKLLGNHSSGMLSVRVGNKEHFIRKSCKKCLECFIMVNIYHTRFRDQTFSELHNNQFSEFVRPELIMGI